MSTRHIRQQPFCWQEKKIRRFLKNTFTGIERVKMRELYNTITEIESDFNSRAINWYTKTIATYSGLSKSFIPTGLKKLEELNIISIEETRDKNGKFKSKKIIFTPENITEMPRVAVSGKSVNGETVNGSTSPLEDSSYLKDSSCKEDSLGSTSVEEATPKQHKGEDSLNNSLIDSSKDYSLTAEEKASIGENKISVPDNQFTIDEMIEKQLEKDVNEVNKLFYDSDPTTNNLLFKNKNQRKVAKDLIKKFGKEQVLIITRKAIEVRGETFAPVITNPIELEAKLIKLKLYLQKEQNKGGRIVMGTNFSEE